MTWNGRFLRASLAVLAVSLVGAWSASLSALGATPRSPKGTVSFALQPGETPADILPLQSGAYYTFANDPEFDWLMYRPLFWIGDNGAATLNPTQSLAEPPVFSANGRTVTITLKHFSWSNGNPVTSRDVRFWIDLVRADKAQWGAYVPGEFPDNLTATRWISPTRFSLTFNRAYNRSWLLYNELSLLFPIPQQSWDRESDGGAIGNYDETPGGAGRVLSFLNAQAKDLSTYASNPLWQVVDGPWRLLPHAGYSPATGYTVLVPNPHYSGVERPTIARLELVPFTNDTAEFDALRSGRIDFGYVPFSDTSQLAYLRRHGYRVASWYTISMSFMAMNYTNPTFGPLFKQLYMRQALQHLLDQPAWVKSILHGFGAPEYGPIGPLPQNTFIDSAVRRPLYPFSVSAARTLLADHGWHVVPNGIDVCTRPGTAATDCGAGVRRGTKLDLTLLYDSGHIEMEAIAESMVSAASAAGIRITATAQPNATVFADMTVCSAPGSTGCRWELITSHLGTYSNFPNYYPTGDEYFLPHAAYNSWGYAEPEATRLILQSLEEAGTKTLHRYEDYMAQQLPLLWMPQGPIDIAAVSDHLKGAMPLDPYFAIYPERWRLTG